MTSVDLEFDQLNSTVDALRRSISNRLMYGVGKDAVTAHPHDQASFGAGQIGAVERHDLALDGAGRPGQRGARRVRRLRARPNVPQRTQLLTGMRSTIC